MGRECGEIKAAFPPRRKFARPLFRFIIYVPYATRLSKSRSKGGLGSLIYLSLPSTFDFEANFRGTWHIYAWRRGGFLVPGLVPIKGNKGRPSQIVVLLGVICTHPRRWR